MSLAANTTYWVVLTGAGAASNTTSNNQSGETGWSIADTYRYRLSGTWAENTGRALRIAIRGTLSTAADQPGTVAFDGIPILAERLTASLSDPDGTVSGLTWRWSRSDNADGTGNAAVISRAAAATYTPVVADVDKFLTVEASYTDSHGPRKTASAVTVFATATLGSASNSDLVSNHYEIDGARVGITAVNAKRAQAFTTGASAATLTAVRLFGGFSTDTVVSVYSDSSGVPGSSVATLANPSGLTSSLSGAGYYQFTAGSGASLSAGTTYWMVFSGAGQVDLTGSSGQNSRSGWTIADGYYRLANDVWTQSSNNQIKMSVEGTEAGSAQVVDPPTVSGSPSVSGAGSDGQWTPGETLEVTLAFDEAVVVDTTDGTPSVGVLLSGSAARSATYVRGSGSTDLVFGYTLVDADGSHSIMFVTAHSLALNGGTIRGQSGSVDAVLGHSGIAVGATVTSDSDSGGWGGSLSSLADEILGRLNQGTSNSGGFSARFEGLPEGHDGTSAFSFELHFSEDPDELSYRTVGGGLLSVQGGSVTTARRLVAGSDLGWELTVVPSHDTAVTVTLPQRDCDAAASVCAGAQPLAEGVSGTVPGPNSAATGAPVIIGTARVAESLTADISAIADPDGITGAVFAYQWTAAGTDIDGATASSYTLSPSEQNNTITVRVSFTDDAGNDETLTSAPTPAVEAPSGPLTASTHNAAVSHNGFDAFTFELRFSEEFTISYTTLRDHAFTVTGGEVLNAKRLAPHSANPNIRWEITVQPNGNGAVTVALPITDDCTATGAICIPNGKKLSAKLELTVPGP